MGLLKNILAPVDGSTYMERNVRYTCDIAKRMGCDVTMLYVVTIPIGIMSDNGYVPTAFFDVDQFRRIGSEVLEKAKKIAQETGIDAKTMLEEGPGNAAQKIIEVAESGGFDLIAIGSRGHSLLRNVLVGSVCDTVFRHSKCPVLAIR